MASERTADIGRRAVADAIKAGVEAYHRERMLPRLIAVEPHEIEDGTEAAQLVILKRLGLALRSERQRGRDGHWTYSLNRHIGLRQAYVAERLRLRALRRARPERAKRSGGPETAAGSGV